MTRLANIVRYYRDLFTCVTKAKLFFFATSLAFLSHFHDWGLVNWWPQLMITSYCYLPNTVKDQSTIRAELTGVIVSRKLES